jgi:hypothetical protein
MPIKRVAHKEPMAKKKSKNVATSWVPSKFEESNLLKAQRDGFLVGGEQVVFPSTERIPKPPERLSGDVPCFSFAWSFSPGPRIPPWASFCLWRAVSPTHAKFYLAHRLLYHTLGILPGGRTPLDSLEIPFLPPPEHLFI